MGRCKVLRALKRRRVEAEWGALTWSASAELSNASELTVGQCLLHPDCHNPLHSHPNCEEVLVVMQGVISHTIMDGKSVTLREGDVISIPKGVRHQARNIGEGDAVMYIAFSSANRETCHE